MTTTLFPTSGEHVTDGLGCWCVPRYVVPCTECGDTDGFEAIAGDESTPFHADDRDMHATVPGCWKCERGLVELSRAEAEANGAAIIVVHHPVGAA